MRPQHDTSRDPSPAQLEALRLISDAPLDVPALGLKLWPKSVGSSRRRNAFLVVRALMRRKLATRRPVGDGFVYLATPEGRKLAQASA